MNTSRNFFGDYYIDIWIWNAFKDIQIQLQIYQLNFELKWQLPHKFVYCLNAFLAKCLLGIPFQLLQHLVMTI